MRRLTLLAAGLVFAGAATAAGEIEPVTRIDATYPQAAAQAMVEGSATIALTVAQDGTVAEAAIVSEAPAGYGFGEAARIAASGWTFTPGASGRYSLTMNFTLDPGETRPVETATGLPTAPPPLKRGRLSYPAEAQIRNENGSVVLIITIEPDGTVSDAEVFSEKPRERGFGKAARKALLASVFAPGIAGRYAVPVHFGIYSDSELPERKPRTRTMKYAPAPATTVTPDYPDAARAKKRAGDVMLAVLIREDGTVDRADIVVETPAGEGFGRAAKRAVEDWTFPLGTKPGVYSLDVPFRLDGR